MILIVWTGIIQAATGVLNEIIVELLLTVYEMKYLSIRLYM